MITTNSLFELDRPARDCQPRFCFYSYHWRLHARVGWLDAPPDPDVLVFTNGDQLTGKLVNSAGGKVTFHSDMAGDVTVDWAKIKEIRTAQKFAVIENGVKPSRKNPEAVPQGTVTIADQSCSGAPRHRVRRRLLSRSRTLTF